VKCRGMCSRELGYKSWRRDPRAMPPITTTFITYTIYGGSTRTLLDLRGPLVLLLLRARMGRLGHYCPACSSAPCRTPHAAACSVDVHPPLHASTSTTKRRLGPEWRPFLENAVERVPITLESASAPSSAVPYSFTPDLTPGVGGGTGQPELLVAAGMNSVGAALGHSVSAGWLLALGSSPGSPTSRHRLGRLPLPRPTSSSRRTGRGCTTEILGPCTPPHTRAAAAPSSPGSSPRCTTGSWARRTPARRSLRLGGRRLFRRTWRDAPWPIRPGAMPLVRAWASEHRAVREGSG